MPASATAVTELHLPALTHVRSGKVRELFDAGDCLLLVATDRISAFDVILPQGIPDKGKVLNQLSAFWFQTLSHVARNHMVSVDDADIRHALGSHYDEQSLAGRAMLVEKCTPLPVECVAREYVAGSLYKEYVRAGGETHAVHLHGLHFPQGLRLCDRLPEVLFTPATKSQTGHDENISFEQASDMIGEESATMCRNRTLTLFEEAAKRCGAAGIILADTKFEFGSGPGELTLIDEALTPDSSRFWPAKSYLPGKPQESMDKQFVRDFLETLDWNKTPPGPRLPDMVIEETRRRYIAIFRQITGREPAI